MKERYNNLLKMYPLRKPSVIFRPSRTVYKSTTIRLDGEEKGARCNDAEFGERCCFGNTTKQRFISAKISYDIFFTDDIRFTERLIPVTLFAKDEIESFLNYLKNVVDFEFTIEYGQVKDFDLFKNDDNFVNYLSENCKNTEIDYRELTGFLLHVTIDAIRPIHAFILQWIRQIYDGRAQFYTDIVYELKKRTEFKNLSLFTIMSLVYGSLRFSEGSTDMCVFPTNMYEGRLSFPKMKDRFDDMNKMFKRFANTSIYSNLLNDHAKEVPADLEEYVYKDTLEFIDVFWCHFGRGLFIENLDVKIGDSNRISIFSVYREMDVLINHYDEIVELFARTASLILSRKWELNKDHLNWRIGTKQLIDNVYKYVRE